VTSPVTSVELNSINCDEKKNQISDKHLDLLPIVIIDSVILILKTKLCAHNNQ